MILNKFLFDKEIAIVLLRATQMNIVKAYAKVQRSSYVIIHLTVRGFYKNLITDSSFAVVDTSNFFDDD